MKNLLFQFWKKSTAMLSALVMVVATIPITFAVGTLDVGFDVSGSTNFPAGTNIPFTINTPTPVNSTNTYIDNNFPDGTYTLTATLPANTEIGPGADYTVTGVNTVSFTMNPGATLTLRINIVDPAAPPPPPTTGTLDVGFDTSGSTNFPAGTNIPFTINTPTPVNSTNTYVDNNFPAGTFTVTATLPANTQFIAGTDYTVTGTNTADFTVSAGNTTTIRINIGDVVVPPPPGGTGTLNLSFDVSGSTNFPAGTNIPFTINTPTPVNSTNTYVDNAFPVGAFDVVATLPANTQVGAGANYTVVNASTANFTMTAGATLNLVITIIDGGAPPGGTGVLTIAFDTSTSTNFPAGTNIPFTINTPTPVNSTNTYTDNNFPAGSFILTATLPANTQIGPGANYVNASASTASFTVNTGATLNLTINVIDAGAPPPPGTFVINPTAGLVTTEAGGQDTFTVALGALPSADVTIAISSADPSEGSVNPTSLTFTNINGTTPQTVTITGVDDALVDGNIPYTIVLAPAVSTDLAFNGLDPADVAVTNNDNDGGGGSGGGGRRRFGFPEITFMKDGEVITALNVPRGETASFTVLAVENSRGSNVNLTLKTDPTTSSVNQATFVVTDQNSQNPSGELSWLTASDENGQFDFIFSATGGLGEVEATLPITISASTTAGSTGGGGGGGGGINIPIEEKLRNCEYTDNKTESVVYLCVLGIIDPPNNEKTYNGQDKDGRYFGRDHITRAAFTKIMVNITYEETTIERVAKLMTKNNFFSFPDVEPAAWFARFITVGKLDDHVHGYPHLGLFVPWNDIEISEATKVLFNTARHDNQKIKSDLEKAAADVTEKNPAWFMKYALLTYAYGGYTPKLDRDPGDIYSKKLTRQQAADIIYTTIQNAGIEAKSHVSALKIELEDIQDEVEEKGIQLNLEAIPAAS